MVDDFELYDEPSFEALEFTALAQLCEPPSKNHVLQWIREIPDDAELDTQKSGKWLIFVSPDTVDDWWEIIKNRTEEGTLGAGAKVSTALGACLRGAKQHVICVYTKDYTDKEDVNRVRRALARDGIVWRIPYKRDYDTVRGSDKITYWADRSGLPGVAPSAGEAGRVRRKPR